jgi:hypothetical protein
VFSPTAAVVVSFNGSDQRQLTLPESGTYVIQVRASDFVSTGSYGLGLECLSATSAVDVALQMNALNSKTHVEFSHLVTRLNFRRAAFDDGPALECCDYCLVHASRYLRQSTSSFRRE